MERHYRMGVHQRDEDEYEEEEYDEYEEEEDASEEEEEEEREEPISQEVQDFLKSREVMKEQIRKKLKKETAAAFGLQSLSQEKRRTQTNDTFGSFFGPSKPVIASRVIEERRSIKETQHIVSRAPSSSTGNFKDAASTSSGQKTLVHHHKPKVVNEVKKKAQTLKNMRDYSFLLSDDADIPSPTMVQRQLPASSNASASKSDVRSAHASSKSRPPMEVSSKSRPPIEASSKSRPPIEASSKSRQGIGASLKSRPPMAGKVSHGPELKNSASKNVQSQTRAVQAKGDPINKPRPGLAEARKGPGCNIANGSGRPVGRKDLPSNHPVKATGTYRLPSKGINDPGLKRQPSAPAVPHPSTQKNQFSEQRKPNGGMDRVKAETKRSLPSSKAVPKPQKKQIPHRDVREDQLKKKPMKRRFDEEDDEEDAIGLIRKMFGYNPNKYAGMDEDDRDMEADFRTIQKEELRSSKIAKKEDEEQLRLIEEEERRERTRKRQKQSRG